MIRQFFALVLIASPAFAQPGRPSFEVASMKPSPPPGNVMRVGCTGGPGTSDPGRVTCENMSLQSLLMRAFELKKYQISGPDWMEDTRYNVDAIIPAHTTKEQFLEMWQGLLTERLKLAFHLDTRELPIYALTIAKGGLKMVEASDDVPAGPVVNTGSGSGGPSPSAGGGGGGARASVISGDNGAPAPPPGGRTGRMSGPRMTLAQLVVGLNFHLDRPVIDQTGLTGKYKVRLEWQVDDRGRAIGTGSADAPTSPDAPVAPTIFAAVQEQLGLKLDARKGPIDMLVIDHAEKTPVEN